MEYKMSLRFDGRLIKMKWVEGEDLPADIPVSQEAGFCYDGRGRVAIIKNERGWGIPGGHPERGETNEEALQREVGEEAYLTVKNPKLIGYIEVKHPKNNSIEGKHYLQLRYAAEVVSVNDFTKEFESSERKFVPIGDLSKFISWITLPPGIGQIEAVKKYLKNQKVIDSQYENRCL